jgi:hypothetical protein
LAVLFERFQQAQKAAAPPSEPKEPSRPVAPEPVVVEASPRERTSHVVRSGIRPVERRRRVFC